jgi:hypothetical protein
MANCTNCATSLAPGAAFCGSCGSAVGVIEEVQGANFTDRNNIAKFNKLLMAVYIVGAILTFIGYGGLFGVGSLLVLPYILFRLSEALGISNKIIFAVLGFIPLVNFGAAIFLSVKAAKFLKS